MADSSNALKCCSMEKKKLKQELEKCKTLSLYWRTDGETINEC
jgi:hypothetical protein